MLLNFDFKFIFLSCCFICLITQKMESGLPEIVCRIGFEPVHRPGRICVLEVIYGLPVIIYLDLFFLRIKKHFEFWTFGFWNDFPILYHYAEECPVCRQVQYSSQDSHHHQGVAKWPLHILNVFGHSEIMWEIKVSGLEVYKIMVFVSRSPRKRNPVVSVYNFWGVFSKGWCIIPRGKA